MAAARFGLVERRAAANSRGTLLVLAVVIALLGVLQVIAVAVFVAVLTDGGFRLG